MKHDEKVEALINRFKYMERLLAAESMLPLTKLKGEDKNTEDGINVFVRLTLDEDNDLNRNKVLAEFIDENGEVCEIYVDFDACQKSCIWPNQFLIVHGRLDNGIFNAVDYYPKIKGAEMVNFSESFPQNHYQV